MDDCKHDARFVFKRVVDAVWKSLDEGASNTLMNWRERFRIVLGFRQGQLH